MDEQPKANLEHVGGESIPPMQASREQLVELLKFDTVDTVFADVGDPPIFGNKETKT